MLLPIAIALGSHLAGALVGLGGRVRSLGPLRTFALVSALAAVLGQLLPDAVGAVGIAALLVFAAFLALPSVLARASAKLGRSNGAVGLELGYAGLVLHQIADGVGLGAYGGAHDAPHIDILAALSAHTVPMVAVVAMAYQRRAGWKVAALRVVGLALATLLGIYFTALVPSGVYASIEPWMTACVAGLLLHVLAHDWEIDRSPQTLGARALDLFAVVAGGALVALGGHAHEHGADVRAQIAGALYDVTIEAAPAIAIGLAITALLSARSAWFHARGRSGGALSVLGLDALAVAGWLAGWRFGLAYAVIGTFVALAVQRFSRPTVGARAEGSFGARVVLAFDERFQSIAPWLVVGLVAAAYAHAAKAESSHALLDVLALALVAIPSFGSPAAAMPLAAVLLAGGASPSAVAAGLLAGAAIASVRTIAAERGLRAAMAAFGASAIAIAAGALVLSRISIAPTSIAHEHAWYALAAAVALALLLVRSIWRAGLRAWLAPLGDAFGHQHEDHQPDPPDAAVRARSARA